MRSACCVVLALLLQLAFPAGAQGALPSSGAVYLTTLPSGADVWIDGVYVGRSPVLVDALERGHHAVTLTKLGWAAREIEISVPDAGTVLSSLELAPERKKGRAQQRGAYVVRGLANGTHVQVDGVAVEPTDVTPIGAGTHVVAVSGPQGRRVRTFTVVAGTTTEVVLRPAPVGASRSAVVAPAQEFLPDGAYRLEGKKVVVRYEGHEAVAHLDEIPLRVDGVTVSYGAAPTMIGGKLYLPLGLLAKLNALGTK
ncbi:MAG: PEGA domain-containing protein [Candidatus Baltobacteraceae bacterium]